MDHFSPDPYHSNYINKDLHDDIKKINDEYEKIKNDNFISKENIEDILHKKKKKQPKSSDFLGYDTVEDLRKNFMKQNNNTANVNFEN